jgi:hypothetical protein
LCRLNESVEPWKSPPPPDPAAFVVGCALGLGLSGEEVDIWRVKRAAVDSPVENPLMEVWMEKSSNSNCYV